MSTLFSETLTRLRNESGFLTAYRFYHDNGGAPAMKVSYRKYLLMEQGKNLPGIDRLERLLTALRIPRNTPEARNLVLDWLKTMAGEEAYINILEPLLSAGSQTSGLSPLHDALRRTLAGKKYHMTPDQFRATLADYDTYRCSFTLENDSGAWSAESLAAALKIKKQAAQLALKSLAEVKLVKEVKKGSYKSLVAGMLVECPAAIAMEPAVREKMRGYFKKLEQDAFTEYSSVALIRADAVAIKGLFPLMHANVEAASTYATVRKTRNSAGFFVIGKVLKLWDF